MATEDTDITAGLGALKISQSSDLILAEDGDVVLVLDDDTRIRTLSSVLSLASVVFKKMFGPHFLEGQAVRSSESPQELRLHDDVPRAIIAVLRVIHFRKLMPPRMYSVRELGLELMEIGVVADKYDCCRAVSGSTDMLMLRCINCLAYKSDVSEDEIFGMAHLASAAYSLKRPMFFRHFTRQLVLTSEGYDVLDDLVVEEAGLSLSVLFELRLQKRAAEDTLVDLVSSEIEKQHCTASDPKGSTANEIFGQELKTKEWPPDWRGRRGTSIGSVLAKSVPPPEVPYDSLLLLTGKQLAKIFKAVNDRAHGLCLACARAEKAYLTCEHAVPSRAVGLKDVYELVAAS
ncbi:hypothetical protein LTR15_008457 [Elasticomyces elasticus]|nr:hypothetical protein LTR15_008457 [Elasticomyces elasticus]